MSINKTENKTDVDNKEKEEGLKVSKATKELEEATIELKNATKSVKSDLDPAREILQSSLKELGIPFKENESFLELAKKLNRKTSDIAKLEADSKLSRKEIGLRDYAKNSNLTNKEFISKCFAWGIPDFYLDAIEETRNGRKSFWYILTDSDASLTKDQLMSKIRSAGVNHINVIAASKAISARVTPKRNK